MRNWIHSKVAPEDIVIGSKVRLARNFDGELFTDKMKTEDAIENVEKVYSILSKQNEAFKLFKLWDLDYNLSKAYMEKHLISGDLLKRKDRGAFVINEDETISIMINEEDHLRIQCITDGFNLKEAYNEANKIDDLIEQEVDYAFHEDYGYLTSSPTNVGTGLRASVMIHLPALTMSEEIPSILKGLNQVGMTISGVYKEGSKVYGNIYEVSNSISLGVNEEEIISNLEGVVLNIISEEKKFREILLTKYNDEIEDKIFRSYGILKSAKLIDSREMLQILSDLRIGVELSLIDIHKETLNRLLIETKDSLLQLNSEKNLTIKDKRIERANLVKKILK